MAFNISNFSSKINSYGIAKENLFEVYISLPPNLQHLDEEFSLRDIPFFCSDVVLPNIDLEMKPYSNQAYGMRENRPTGFSKGGLSASFILDSNLRIQRFFEKWFYSILNVNNYDDELSLDASGKFPYELAYQDSYAGSLETIIYNETGQDVYRWNFSGVYPTGIPSRTYSWGSSTNIPILAIGFSYSKFKTTAMEDIGVSGIEELRSRFEAEYMTSRGTMGYPVSRPPNLP